MSLVEVLKRNFDEFGMVLDVDYRTKPYGVIDFTSENAELEAIRQKHGADVSYYVDYVNSVIDDATGSFGIGLYDENRAVYSYTKPLLILCTLSIKNKYLESTKSTFYYIF